MLKVRLPPLEPHLFYYTLGTPFVYFSPLTHVSKLFLSISYLIVFQSNNFFMRVNGSRGIAEVVVYS